MGRKTQRNVITSTEKTAQINPFNLQLKEEFLDYLRSVQRSPKTIAGYDNDLLIVLTYILDHCNNKKFTELTKRDIIAMQNWFINDNNNSPARVRRIKSAVSSMSNFIENVLDEEPEFEGYKPIVRKVANPVLQPVREKTVLSEEEVESLLQMLHEEGEHKKACFLALAVYSGRRKSELPRFKVSDFEEKNLICDGALYKTTDTIKTKGFGLGKYIYCYTLAKGFKPYFDAWMQQREELGIESEWLFPDEKDPTQQIPESTMNSWAGVFSRRLGKDVYLHSLRHFFTTYLVRSGLPDSVIVSIVGWSDPSMIKVYTDIDADEQIGLYFKDGEINVENKKSLSDL